MTHQELTERMTAFARRVAVLTRPLFERRQTEELASQLSRASASAAANYRAAGHGRSHAEFRSKIGLALEEADESAHWLQFLKDTEFATGSEVDALLKEGLELVRILGASARTAGRNARLNHSPRARRRPPGR